MNWRTFVNFIKDKTALTAYYFLGNTLLIIFYQLSTAVAQEVLYPAAIAVVVYLILMLHEWSKYYKFANHMHLGSSQFSSHKGKTREQIEMVKLMREIKNESICCIESLRNESRNNYRFLSQWLHNMKTPVSIVDLIIQQYQQNKTMNDDMINSIKEENDKLLNNLEQVLNIIRLEEFSKDYEPMPVNLVFELKRIINNMKNQFLFNNVFPKLHIEQDNIEVLTDIKWNEVMLDQIISNAIKYSKNGEESRTVNFYIEQDNKVVSLVIQDEGIGIPDYDLKRVFEPFFTGENGRKNRNSTGIGLYICSEIAKKLKHSLKITSQVGKGTVVKIGYLTKL